MWVLVLYDTHVSWSCVLGPLAWDSGVSCCVTLKSYKKYITALQHNFSVTGCNCGSSLCVVICLEACVRDALVIVAAVWLNTHARPRVIETICSSAAFTHDFYHFVVHTPPDLSIGMQTPPLVMLSKGLFGCSCANASFGNLVEHASVGDVEQNASFGCC